MPAVRSPSRPEIKPDVDTIVEAILYLYTESRRLMKGVAASFGLTGPQLTVVKMLDEIGDMSLSELSERIRAQNSTVTGIIDRMEREGLVARSRSREDRRVVHIRLTAKGHEVARRIPIAPLTIFREAIEELGPTDGRELLRILTRVARRVRELVDASNPKESR